VALEIPGETRNKRVLEFLESSVAQVRQSGKAAGCLFHDLKELDYFMEIGVQFLAYKVDSSVLYDGFSFVRDFKA
jgi:2-keto-3-deoxy-L-rhamnonate aldolase RhmA